MKQEGINLDGSEVAWFFKQKLNLIESHKQMLEATLGAESEDYAAPSPAAPPASGAGRPKMSCSAGVPPPGTAKNTMC